MLKSMYKNKADFWKEELIPSLHLALYDEETRHRHHYVRTSRRRNSTSADEVARSQRFFPYSQLVDVTS